MHLDLSPSVFRHTGLHAITRIDFDLDMVRGCIKYTSSENESDIRVKFISLGGDRTLITWINGNLNCL
jgi:hypothetical protein